MPAFVDLSHTIADGMRPYPGLPSPRIGPILDHDASRPNYNGRAEFYLGKVDMPCNVGTYIDSPFHRHRGGADLSQLPLDRMAALPGIVLDAPSSSHEPIEIEAAEAELGGCAVLIRTGWAKRWGTDAYWAPAPFLSARAIEMLVRAGAVLAGVDFWNVDDTNDPERPAHTRLLAAGILIVENLADFAALPRAGFRFSAVPPPIVRGASFPVRAFAELD